MLITKVSELTGVKHTREINVTEDQIRIWQDGEYIQRAMSNLTVEEREFIMTGTTPEEWTALFPEVE
jgi:hypothetical protein